jgi:hypothetical protein
VAIALAAALGGLPAALPAHDAPAGGTEADAARTALLRDGEQALARGATDDAIALFDRAALMRHAADTELDLVRAYMQAGEYRRALGFAAHVAGAHTDAPDAAALYAWLLRAGGQGAYGRRVIDAALQRMPGDPLLAAVRTQLAQARPAAAGTLLEAPQRYAPLPLPADPASRPAEGGRYAGSGVMTSARSVLVPLDALDGARRLWVRNGLGETAEAAVERRWEVLGLAQLALHTPLKWDEALLVPAPREPFAGSPAFVVAHAPTAEPAWPLLSAGFLGPQSTGRRSLGIDPGEGALGGPVFDVAGRWTAIAMRGADGGAVLIPVSALRAVGLAAAPAAPERSTPAGADAIYEGALRSAVQVISAP